MALLQHLSPIHLGLQVRRLKSDCPHLVPPNSALQRAGTPKVLGRGRSGAVLAQVLRARELIRWRAVAELSS
jgi:hypothetical protein